MQTQPSTVICRAGCRTRSPPESVRYTVSALHEGHGAEIVFVGDGPRRDSISRTQVSGFPAICSTPPESCGRHFLEASDRSREGVESPSGRHARTAVLYFVDEVQGVQPHGASARRVNGRSSHHDPRGNDFGRLRRPVRRRPGGCRDSAGRGARSGECGTRLKRGPSYL